MYCGSITAVVFLWLFSTLQLKSSYGVKCLCNTGVCHNSTCDDMFCYVRIVDVSDQPEYGCGRLLMELCEFTPLVSCCSEPDMCNENLRIPWIRSSVALTPSSSVSLTSRVCEVSKCHCRGPVTDTVCNKEENTLTPYCAKGTVTVGHRFGCFTRITCNKKENNFTIDYGCDPDIGGTEEYSRTLCKTDGICYCYQDYCNNITRSEVEAELADFLHKSCFSTPSESPFEIPSSSFKLAPTATFTEPTADSGSDSQQLLIIPYIVVPVVILIIIILLSITVWLIYKKTKGTSFNNTSSSDSGYFDRKDPNNGGESSGVAMYTYMDITPTPISISDITLSCTSGSGGGLPHLVERTIARGTLLDNNIIGGGRFGQVYLGYYQGEKYAVKKFFSKDEQSWFREKEIYKNFNMRHDNILMYVAADILSNNGVTELWLVTQFHPRGSLFDELHRDPLTVEQTFKYIFSAARGIAYLHVEFPGAQGKPSIAHRDLKSRNLLVKNDDTLCIADFGLAVVKNGSQLSEPDNLRQGTKRYMAPELLEEKVNPANFVSFIRTDIYSFGIVLWEICRRSKSGGPAEMYELPFEYEVPHDPSFEDMREVVVLKGLTPELPDRWNQDDLLKSLSKLMSECWLKDPAARPTSFYIKKKLSKILDNCNLKISMNF